MRTTSTFNIMGNIIQLPTYLGVYKIFQNCKAGPHSGGFVTTAVGPKPNLCILLSYGVSIWWKCKKKKKNGKNLLSFASSIINIKKFL